MPESKTYRIVDLFAGIGGLSGGVIDTIEKHGDKAQIVFTSEIKKPAIEVLKANHKRLNLHGDIRNVLDSEIPPHDILLAGFPCQAFSTAGYQRGFEDKTRGTLFFEVARILKARKPEYFILENVEGLIFHDSDATSRQKGYGKTLEVILNTLTSLGYKVSWTLLDATGFNVPQRRKRVFIVGSLTSTPALPDNITGTSKPLKSILQKNITETDKKVNTFSDLLLKTYPMDELLGKFIRDKRGGSNNIHSWMFNAKGKTSKDERELLEKLALEARRKAWAVKKNIPFKENMALNEQEILTFYTPPKTVKLVDMLERLYELKYLSKTSDNSYRIQSGKLSFPLAQIVNPNGYAPTLVATDADRLGIPDNGKLRRLTLKELKRLFGFPDSFVLDELTITRSQIFDLFGNSVVRTVSAAVSEKVLYGDILKEELKEV